MLLADATLLACCCCCPALTDSTAFVFLSMLRTPPPPGSNLQLDTSTWRVLVSKGEANNQIKPVWFRDGSTGQCPKSTSLSVRAQAGGDLAGGTCQLNFKVSLAYGHNKHVSHSPQRLGLSHPSESLEDCELLLTKTGM